MGRPAAFAGVPRKERELAMSTPDMPIPVKKCPRPPEKFVTFVLHLVTCLTGNLSVPNPTPTVQSLAIQAKELAAAIAKAKDKGPGAVSENRRCHHSIQRNHQRPPNRPNPIGRRRPPEACG